MEHFDTSGSIIRKDEENEDEDEEREEEEEKEQENDNDEKPRKRRRRRRVANIKQAKTDARTKYSLQQKQINLLLENTRSIAYRDTQNRIYLPHRQSIDDGEGEEDEDRKRERGETELLTVILPRRVHNKNQLVETYGEAVDFPDEYQPIELYNYHNRHQLGPSVATLISISYPEAIKMSQKTTALRGLLTRYK